MSRPTTLHVGEVLYWVIRTRDPDTMQLADADSTPTVVVRKNGASTVDSVTVTKRAATTGIYDCSYDPAGEAEGDHFTIEETADVTGTTTASAEYEFSWSFTVVAVERGTDGANTTAPDNAGISAAAADALAAKTAAESVDSKLTSGRASNLDNLDVAISVIQSQITALNNLSAKANWFGSLLLEIPDSGTRDYLFELVVRDDEDKLVNLDGLPTIALVNAAGTDRSSLITTAIANPSTGRYTLTISVGTSTTNESLKLTASGTVSGEARYAVIAPQVVDYDSATQINTILTRIGTPAVSVSADIAALNDLDSTDVQTAAAAALTAYDPPTNAEMNARTLASADYATSTALSALSAVFTGITSIGDWIRRIVRKDAGTAGMATAETEINTGGTATFSGTTDAAEAIRDRGDAAWTTGGGGGSDDVVLEVPFNTTQPLIRVRLPGDPTDVAYNDADLSISYRVETQDTYTTLTLEAGTLGTWSSSSFVKEGAGSFLYQLGLPEAAIVDMKKTYLRVTYAGDTLHTTLSATTGSDAEQATLLEVQDAVDAYIASVVASVDGSAGTIVGFPESLNIGDSYTQDSGNAISVFIRDSNDNPISSVGTHAFTDPDFAPELVIASSGNVGRVRATLEYVDPGAPAEPYLRVELPSKETRRAVEGVATMQCVLKWDDCQKTIATQSVTWVARV